MDAAHTNKILSEKSKRIPHVVLGLIIALTGCQSAQDSSSGKAANAQASPAQRMADLQVVDCLLPGQVRSLGNTTYLTPRRPTRTTASDCRIRGGEYVSYDRADYKTALAVWMESAEKGDAEAQANVGEIFERGLGATPNYDAAVIWYKKSAEQGNRRAQFNLGTLYEQGLGVPKDMAEALNWYRKAWGLPAEDLTYQSVKNQEAENLRAQLQQEIEKKNQQIRALERQVEALRKSAGGNAQLKSQIADLNSLIADLRKDKKVSEDKSDALHLRQPNTKGGESSPLVAAGNAAPVSANNIDFGRYYALLIGDQDYQKIEPLKTPLNDINEIGNLLKNKYGFSVSVIKDADNISIMEAINNLNGVLTEKDNLLIYYAGHGSRVKTGGFDAGYWLPINADPPPRDTYWISSEFITRHLARMKAKRVMVIADSCYGGLLANEPGFLVLGNAQKPSDAYIRYKLDRRSRLLLTSGGNAPVLDNGGGQNSIFAKSVIDVLSRNNQLLIGPEFFNKVHDEVVAAAKAVNFQQEPEYRAIKDAGHEVGDFFFVPIDANKKVSSVNIRNTLPPLNTAKGNG